MEPSQSWLIVRGLFSGPQGAGEAVSAADPGAAGISARQACDFDGSFHGSAVSSLGAIDHFLVISLACFICESAAPALNVG
jgi:hypothetical protein